MTLQLLQMEQRKNDTYGHIYKSDWLKRRKKASMDRFESEELSKFCKKTCHYESFKAYCQKRLEKETESKKLYRKKFFRSFKFTTYCRVKHSEAMVVKRINETFKNRNPKISVYDSNEKLKEKFRGVTNNILENAKRQLRNLLLDGVIGDRILMH